MGARLTELVGDNTEVIAYVEDQGGDTAAIFVHYNQAWCVAAIGNTDEVMEWWNALYQFVTSVGGRAFKTEDRHWIVTYDGGRVNLAAPDRASAIGKFLEYHPDYGSETIRIKPA